MIRKLSSLKNEALGVNVTRGSVVDTLATLLITAGIGFLVMFLTFELFYLECAQKASTCSDSFYSVFDLLVVGVSVAGITAAGGKVALAGAFGRTAISNLSILAINGLVLTALYGLIPTMIFGLEGTIDYGSPLGSSFSQRATRFSPRSSF